MAAVEVRSLTPGDVEAFVRLRREALVSEPLAFVASPVDDRALDPPFVRQSLRAPDTSALFGAFAPDLVGAVGIHRDSHQKAAHKAHVWGMFVRPEWRRSGVGGALLAAAIGHARGMAGVTQVHLGVSETAGAALRLYERHGFRIWGTEPAALAHAGRFVAEHHLVFALPPPPVDARGRLRSREGCRVSELRDVTDESFAREILESEVPALVDFWGDHCPACRQISPILRDLAQEYAGRLRVFKLHAADNPATSARYGVRAMPTVLAFARGQVMGQLVGARPKTAFVELIGRVL